MTGPAGEWFLLGPAAVTALKRKLARHGADAEARLHHSMAKAQDIAMQFPRLRACLATAAAKYG